MERVILSVTNDDHSLHNRLCDFQNDCIGFKGEETEIKTKKSFCIFNDTLRQRVIICPVNDYIYLFMEGGRRHSLVATYSYNDKHVKIKPGIKKETQDLLVSYIQRHLTLTHKYENEYKAYLLNNENNKLWTISTRIDYCHWGHAFIDGLVPLFESVDKFDIKYLYTHRDTGAVEYYFKEADIFNGIVYNTSLRVLIDYETIFKDTCIDNLYYYRWSGYIRSQECVLPNKLTNYLKNSLYINTEVDNISNNKKVILLVGKTNIRYALNQVEAYRLIINFFKQKFSNVIFLYQGYTQTNTAHDLTEHTLKNNKIIPFNDYENLYEQISVGYEDIVINLNGKRISDYVAYVKHVDYYFSPQGSVQHYMHNFTKTRKGLIFVGTPGKYTNANTREPTTELSKGIDMYPNADILYVETVKPTEQDTYTIQKKGVNPYHRCTVINLNVLQDILNHITF